MGFTALLLSVGTGRQVKRRAQEGMPGESHQRFPAAFPSLLLRRTRLVVVAVNQLLCTSWSRGTRESFITQIHAPCASSAALLTLAAAPAFYAGFESKQNVSVAEEGMRDVFVRYVYELAHLWDRYLQRTQLNKSDLKSIL